MLSPLCVNENDCRSFSACVYYTIIYMRNQPGLVVSTEYISMAVIGKNNKEKPAEAGLY
jgi:hypothetical protein